MGDLRESASRPTRAVIVLVVSPPDDDVVCLRQILSHTNWTIHWYSTCGEAVAALHQNRISVVLCERDLPDGHWKDVLEHLALLAYPPLLIVTSRLADEYLWAEVLNLGGYDVLMKPFDAQEVIRVVSLAWRRWKSEQERKKPGSDFFKAAV